MTPTESLLFGIRRSARYHTRRRRFYELWTSTTITAAATGGPFSALAATVDDLAWVAVVASALIGFLAAVNLGIGAARYAILHAELAARFMRLEQQFPPRQELDSEALAAATRGRLEIETDEPAPLVLLNIICHIELLYSQGHRGKFPKIPGWRRSAAPFFSQYNWAQTYIANYLTPPSAPS